MGTYSLKKYLQIKAEREERKAERERIRREKAKEKEKEKKRLQREREKIKKQKAKEKEKEKRLREKKKKQEATHKAYMKRKYAARKLKRAKIRNEKENEEKYEKYRELRKKINKKYYASKVAAKAEQRIKSGDEEGFYSIYITHNRNRVMWVGSAVWKSDAYDIFNTAIEMNRESSMVPQIQTTNSVSINYKEKNQQDAFFEIIIVKKITDSDESSIQIRDDSGKFIENVIVDSNEHVIVNKDKWFVEETFNVYGYHPVRDRKDAMFIYENIILNNLRPDGDPKRIRTLHNKLIIEDFYDFDFVIAKDANDCQRLYHALMKKASIDKCKQIVFTGEIPYNLTTATYDKIEEKTGWPRSLCVKYSAY